jgi:formate dehydrogenase major subunit/formate dehydrogenase alpha subunit
VAGLAASFGSGAMSNSLDDIVQHARALFVIGSNTTEQHPVFGAKIRQAVLRRKIPLVVADPRKIDLAEFAALHLRHRPGTDAALLNGLMYLILDRGWQDDQFIAERTEGFEAFEATVRQYPPEKAAAITGVPVEQLRRAAEIMGAHKPMAVIWAMGITQHIVGVRNVMALANLQMLLGNMGLPGGGVNPLRGQNNVQGACDMGALPNVFPGYQPVTDEEVREKFEAAWELKDELGRMKDEASLPDFILHPSSFILSSKVGMTVTEMIPAAGEGRIKALYIVGEDPAMSDPNSAHIRACLEACEFVAVQEIFPSETSKYADVLLPGVSFAEKTGTFTNTERRIQMCRKAIAPEGDDPQSGPREDWRIIADLARRVLADSGLVTNGKYAGWDYTDTSEIMAEIAALTPSYAGVTHERLERGERLQWPVNGLDHPGTPILHVGRFTRGKGRFAPIDHLPPAELPDDEYPLILSTGRVLYHWHGGEMTRRAQGLLAVYGEPLVEVNPDDAAQLGLNGCRRVRVTSRRGRLEAEAWITDRVPPGMVYANFHFPEANANELTLAALDPVAKIPEYKVCAVKVERAA